MPFRLNLKGYQGNCKTCWKKSDKKLFVIANENPEYFDFMNKMEQKYGRIGAEIRKDPTAPNRLFFRGHRSVEDILQEAINFNEQVKDDSVEYDFDLSDSESCEVFSQCGD